MIKRIILCALLIGFGLSACQTNPFSAEDTPIVIPTRLILPSPTSTSEPLPSPSLEPTATVPATQVPPTPQPSLVKTYVGKYSALAKGIELNESTVKVDPAKLQADFGIVYGGYGEDDAKNYAAYIHAVNQADIPCLLLWDIIIPAGMDASNMEKTFPPEGEEPNVAAIARVARGQTIAGIIIRFMDKKTPEGKTFTQLWMSNYIAWMVEAVYHQTGKPLFVMTSQAFIDGFGKAPQLNQTISSIDGMSSWKSAMPGQSPQLASWNDFPVPGDDYAPEYISNNPTVSFINYARTAWKFDGINASSTPLWLYKAPASQLRKDLGFKGRTNPTPASPTPTRPSTMTPTSQYSPTPAPPSKYSARAKGIELNGDTVSVDSTRLRADFGVVYGGEGWDKAVSNYQNNILALDQANIPCLLLWDILIPPGFDASRPDKSFPPENEEPNVAAIVRSTRGKAVAGIIIRFLDKKTPEGKIFTQGWMANYIAWIVNAVQHQTGKPLFVMTSQAFIEGFGDAPSLYGVISGLDAMSSWKPAMSEETPQLASWNDFPLPGNDYVPEYISDNGSLYFINYARNAWRFDGIDASATPLWMYYSTPARLKKDLGYQDHVMVTPTP